jgi:hypothetical protein
MSYPFDQISGPQERTVLAQPSLHELKARLGSYAGAAFRNEGATGPDARARASLDFDDWTGSFDMHLGVYASD